MKKVISSIVEFVIDPIGKIFYYPFKKEEERKIKKCDEFLSKVKKPYSERTDAENIIFYSYYMIYIKGGLNRITKYFQFGATEASLILESYLEKDRTDFENEDYVNLIKTKSEQYFKDHNIL